MAVFYAIEQGLVLHKDGQRLLAKKEGKVKKAIHFHTLEQVVLIGQIGLTPAVISALLKRNIDTVFLTKSGRYLGRLMPMAGKNIELRLRQFERFQDMNFRERIARAIVKGKVENQRLLLRRINRKGLGLEDTILRLKQLAKKTEEADIASLRGIEGTAARFYFEGLAKGFNEDWQFKGREKRPPKDPLNALLSLGYTLLFSNVLCAINLVGLDPYLGCFHSIDYGRPALAFDLMEEWRAVIVDALVLSVINRKVISRDNFAIEEEGVYLSSEGWQKFITQFERKMNEKVTHPEREEKISYRAYIEDQVRRFCRDIKGEEEYKAVVFR